MNKIEVTDAGPIDGTFSIDLSSGPGVYEFRGARGTGKTTCISSIDWLAGHKVDVTLHDGAVSGSIEGFGVVAPIGGRKRRKGGLDLDTLDAEKFSITDILDSQGKTPEVRDAIRIKALAVLSGAKADPDLYYELAGGQAEFDALGITPSDDPVLLATRVKSALDKRAREAQNTAEAEAKHAIPLEHVPDGLDISGNSDLDTLSSERDAARDELQRLKSMQESGIRKAKETSKAKERLQKIQQEYTGLDIKESREKHEKAEEAETTAVQRVHDIERELEAARTAVETCKKEVSAAYQAYKAAESHAAAVEELESIASQSVTYPEESAIDYASEAVSKATVAYNQGLRIRDILIDKEKAKAHREAEKAAIKLANASRNKAAQVFDVLARSLNTQHLKIRSVDGNPRLFAEHPKRGQTAFDQINGLSDGERVDFTLKELIPHVDSPGLLPIPQRVWQDLQPSDRKNLHELAVEKGLYLFGAQVDDGDLRVVFLEEEGPR